MKRPLSLVLAGVVLGEATAIWCDQKGFFVMASLALFAMVCSLLSWRARKRKRSPFFWWLFLGWVCFVVGGVRFLSSAQPTVLDARLEKGDCEGEIAGVIDSVKIASSGNYQVVLKDAVFSSEEQTLALREKCRLSGISSLENVLRPGDHLRCAGSLSALEEPTNPGEFPSKTYNYSLGIRCRFFVTELREKKEGDVSPARAAYLLRERLSAVYGAILAPGEQSLLEAMVLGDKTGLSREQRLLYEENGAAHLLAVSGLHMSIVGGNVFRFFRRRKLGYGISCAFGAAFLAFYAVLTGFGNSVFRALVMFLTFLLAEYFGAEYDMISAMSLAGAWMLLDSPWRLLESGCLVSFASIFALGYVLPFVKEKSEYRRQSRFVPGELPLENAFQKRVRESIAASLTVTAVTGPLLLRFYYQWSPYSILLNLLLLPAMNPLMIGAICGGFLGMANTFLGFLGCLPAFVVLKFFEFLFVTVRKIPGSLLVTGCPPWWVVAALYGLEILAFFLWYHRKWTAIFGLLLALSAAFFLRPSADLRMVMLDVGQGDGIFFQMPDGNNVLLDGGSTTKEKLADYTLIPAFKYYGADHLDYVFVTHTDEDHISGICELLEEKYPIANLVLPDVAGTKSEEDLTKLCELAEENHTRVLAMGCGDAIYLGEVKLSCLYPKSGMENEEKNADSIVLYLTYGHFEGLFTGDLPGEREADLPKALPGMADGIDLLKTAHHGSKYSTSEAFLKRYRPKTAILSAGKNNRYNHPHPDTVKRLKKSGADTYATCWGGAIVGRTDGEAFSLRYFR